MATFLLPINVVIIRCLIVLSLSLAMLSIAKAADEHDAQPIVDVTLATGKHYSPFVDASLPDGGWSVSIVKGVLEEMSLSYSLTILPWERALKWTREDKLFATFPYVYSERRAKTLLYSNPINFVPVHMYVAKHADFSDIESLTNKRLCFPYDYALSTLEKEVVDKLSMTVNRVKDSTGCIRHVHKGWSDAGLINGHINADKLSLDNNLIKIFPKQIVAVPLSLVINKSRENAQAWMDQFNNALTIINNNGERALIDQQYYLLLNQH
ncbi:transporter substrate-binding domain-containing protein [Paraglaciecola aquimarina]|uniref:Transporter substrate-binding domain-containing protein n=1 Tax=Paraglaciecola aquimarina TaxID=1235557 RepID=A0ABU3T1A2_9ALTE|nr:transporter substrate-binding domain-containing protein [Paraglaciecola aquimarina]MDU0356047.1 transporter substrate-binding domain-containing protein [Paraglaciecola aquimarina]